MSFWLRFAINEMLTILAGFIAVTTLTDQQKADADALIAAAQKFLSDF